MSKYGLTADLIAKPGKGKELAKILLKAAELMRSAKGAIVYIVSQDPENDDLIWVYEVWKSKKDHGNSLSIDGVSELVGQAMPLLAEPPRGGRELKVLGGLGTE
ncbi:MAG: putative quinol monooxygenase [Candidatus Kariarchaeaceae archaeon]|jgi:quinol monooxygenase YgiN